MIESFMNYFKISLVCGEIIKGKKSLISKLFGNDDITRYLTSK